MNLTVISLILSLMLVGATILIVSNDGKNNDTPANNVGIVDGKQIIELRAKGGYRPARSTAKAGIPTILKVDTSGTFDCSSAIRIPSLRVSKNLPPSGSTEIDLGVPAAGMLQGTCGMGMYPFEILFES